MPTMKITAILAITAMILVGCQKEPTSSSPQTTSITKNEVIALNVVDAKVGDFIVDLTGKKYRKVTDEIVKSNGFTVADVWERVGDKRSWYTPTLGSKMDKNSTPLFNSLSRNPGEEYPTF